MFLWMDIQPALFPFRTCKHRDAETDPTHQQLKYFDMTAHLIDCVASSCEHVFRCYTHFLGPITIPHPIPTTLRYQQISLMIYAICYLAPTQDTESAWLLVFLTCSNSFEICSKL